MVLHHECFHIRKSADRSLFAAPRSLSQLVTSFFGSWCQGIHLMLLFAWTSFSWSITFVAMIDPWFSFFRIAWVSWTFWLSLLACKKVCIIAFLSRAVSNLPPFGEIVSHFRAYLTLYLERPIKCVVFICPQISVRFLLKTSIFTLIFLIRLSKISFRPRSLLNWSVWMDSNHRPRAYQARALATWATDRFSHLA